ncbi:MAG: hybrid sensor histidine kinase/response regulator, partial [Desulfohalobiaceae bacterium]
KTSESQMLATHEDLERRLLLQTEELSMTNLMLKRQVVKKEEAEKALAAEKELLAVTLRSIGDGVMAMDTQNRVMLMNTVAEDLTGWQQDEAVGRELHEVFPIVDAATREPKSGPRLQVMGQDSAAEFPENVALLTRDQREIEVEDCLAPIYDSRNEIIGSVLVFRDVSERRQQEIARLRSEKLESLGVLAGGIAHDFNNILTAILNNIILARLDSSNPEGVRGKLTEAEQATLRAKQLTQQLLTFSKGGVPVRESTSIGELIIDSATFSLRGSNVRCTFSIQEGLWPADVDCGQIVQVVDNLVINADQAMPDGGEIHIRVENLEVADGSGLPLFPGRYVQISVIDHGVGIPENLLQQIFDPYFTTKDTGNGLGLATAYSIVKNHGGHVEVDSKPGAGSTFRIQLPAACAAPEQRATESQAPLTGQGKILVMDDEPSVRDILKETLDYLGYQPDFAPDGQQAIDLYTRHLQEGRPFDAVIMDLTIPGGMGGKEAIQELLRIDPDVRAIVSSGYSQDPVMAHYERHGFKNVLMKPYTVDEVGRKLHAVLGTKSPA